MSGELDMYIILVACFSLCCVLGVFFFSISSFFPSGAKMQSICDECAITLNKNTVPGDTSALNPGGVRLGSSALTTRGFNISHFNQVKCLY